MADNPLPTYQHNQNNPSEAILQSQNHQQSPENPNKPLKYTANQIAIMALKEQGLNSAETARELGLSKGYITYVDKKLNRKYDLTDNKLVKGAHKTIRNLSQGIPVGTIEKVKDSTALAAAGMIYDRYQPAIHHTSNITTDNINISVDKSAIQDMQTIDIDNNNISGISSDQMIDTHLSRQDGQAGQLEPVDQASLSACDVEL